MHCPKAILLTLFDLLLILDIIRAKSHACWAILPRITVLQHTTYPIFVLATRLLASCCWVLFLGIPSGLLFSVENPARLGDGVFAFRTCLPGTRRVLWDAAVAAALL